MTVDLRAVAFVAEHARLPAELVAEALRVDALYLELAGVSDASPRASDDAGVDLVALRAADRRLLPTEHGLHGPVIDFGAEASFIALVGRGMTAEIAASVLIGLAAFQVAEGLVDPSVVLLEEASATDWLGMMVPRVS